MTDSSGRYGDKPLGKSVEEVEAQEGNRVNSPVPGEAVRQDEPVIVPAVSNSNLSTNPGVLSPDSLQTDTVISSELNAQPGRDRGGQEGGESSES